MKPRTLIKKPEPPEGGTAQALERYAKKYAKWSAQQEAALRLFLYFNKLWQRKKNAPIVWIPLKRLNETVTRGDRHLVKFIANIWFQQEHRGNSYTGKVSAWTVRKNPALNSQLVQCIKSLTDENKDSVQEMWTVLGQKHTVEVVIKTTVKFQTEEQARLFAELMNMKEKE